MAIEKKGNGMKPRIALTGGIACGKSLLAKYLNARGVETLDADDIVHELVPEEERRRIADEIFRDPEKRKELEARLHPLVRARLAAFASPEKGGRDGARPARSRQSLTTNHCPLSSKLPTTNYQLPTIRVEIIPLLFECHWETDYDIIICVSSPRHLQVDRLTTLRGYTEEQAEARLAAQLPAEVKAARSDYVILNDGSVENLEHKAQKLVEWLKGSWNG